MRTAAAPFFLGTTSTALAAGCRAAGALAAAAAPLGADAARASSAAMVLPLRCSCAATGATGAMLPALFASGESVMAPRSSGQSCLLSSAGSGGGGCGNGAAAGVTALAAHEAAPSAGHPVPDVPACCAGTTDLPHAYNVLICNILLRTAAQRYTH